MKSISTLILLLLLSGVTPLVAQQEVKEQLTVPLSDPGKPGTLEVGLVNGSIQVQGYNGKEVMIEAVAGAETNKEKNKPANEPAGGMRRITPNAGLDLSAEEKGNRVKIESNSFTRPVHLTIKVPQRFSLKLSTVNGGTLSVENVSGDFELNNVNGPIELTNVGGSAVANTINGPIKAVFRELNSTAPMAFSTLNGPIDVTFPATAKASVKMKSDRGDIFSDFDMTIDKSQPQATRTSQSGMYRVAVESWVNGKINGGGPEIMMKSMQGNIYVRKASR
ncbi:DUF4097 family beta strand repeat-containing protein [Rhabdobacter roseus]|uniref:DUF4097 and DUF4098 domain-containing protein YvlB n=1 Tax=Rhabdobacter roseus TaxID=1655419 RepID=A0A840TWK9_9BACT|nr:DUF4097 family beta strand repeat-containing protein [Rhabdobacter roseus]MBB5284029.1 DUF4097 and DUF4098 domain-containing protein YvlB [Rhabdobacter roseus]